MSTIRNRLNLLVAQKEERERRQIPLTQITEETGITTKTLSLWARNKITRFDAATLVTLCEWVPCTVGELLYLANGNEEAEAK